MEADLSLNLSEDDPPENDDRKRMRESSMEEYSSSSMIQKKSKSDKIAPIIIFGGTKAYKKDYEISKYIKTFFNEFDKEIFSKTTANGNILIFPKSTIDKNKILNNKKFFENYKKIDLGLNQKKLVLMVKGTTGTDLKEFFDNDDYTQSGIKSIESIFNKENKEMKMCKVEIISNEEFNNLIRKGKMRIGTFNYTIEEIQRPPIRCSRCKKFGHVSINCSDVETCGKCGSTEHAEMTCTIDNHNQRRCVNCNDHHSSYYRGCKVIKKSFKDKLLENNDQGKKIKSGTEEYHRVYSRFNEPKIGYVGEVEIKNGLNKISEKLNEQINELSNKIDKLNEEITKSIQLNIEKVKELTDEAIINNNSKLIYFTMELLFICINNADIKKPEKIKDICKAFTHHQLGTPPEQKNLKEYFEKLCQKKPKF